MSCLVLLFFSGDMRERLRNALRRMRMYGGAQAGELEALQRMYPGVNVTQMYDSPWMLGGDGYAQLYVK